MVSPTGRSWVRKVTQIFQGLFSNIYTPTTTLEEYILLSCSNTNKQCACQRPPLAPRSPGERALWLQGTQKTWRNGVPDGGRKTSDSLTWTSKLVPWRTNFLQHPQTLIWCVCGSVMVHVLKHDMLPGPPEHLGVTPFCEGLSKSRGSNVLHSKQPDGS